MTVIKWYWLSLTKPINFLLIGALNTLLLGQWALACVNCPTYLLEVTRIITLISPQVILPTLDCGRYLVGAIRKLTFYLSNFLYNDCSVFQILLNSFHLG